MVPYQILARKYRPQTFAEVVGQEAIVATLRNAIKLKRLAHAYLFSGPRGTGKTTLARLFAKALNCLKPTQDGEPCNICPSCKEITTGHSLDVLEIDGASNRGIDEMRQINETVGYATSTGGFKIYIIDEVHMLTKEAFNALLKTLEEPPPHVKFFFATTEPHKVLPTILSRCQRFTLHRLPVEKIVEKLTSICSDLKVEIEEEALLLLATLSEGGLRDAESLLDQIISFQEGKVSVPAINSILGRVARDIFFELDRAGKEGNLAKAFELAHQIFTEGKDLIHFVESLTEHFRNLLLVKLSGKEVSFLTLSDAERDKYELSAKLYTQDQCLTLIDFLIESEQQIRFATSPKIALEAILLRVLRTHQRLPIEYLVRRLTELEKAVTETLKSSAKESDASVGSATGKSIEVKKKEPEKVETEKKKEDRSFMSIDPSPSLKDLGTSPSLRSPSINEPLSKLPAVQDPISKKPPLDEPLAKNAESPSSEGRVLNVDKQRRYDTLLQFAAVELEGTIQKNSIR